MKPTIGVIGAGNMARALAIGLGQPLVFTDGGSGRAEILAQEVGGEALRSNQELAQRADIVVLAHKPSQLDQVAHEIAGVTDGAVVSLLARTPLSTLNEAYPEASVFRVQPNLAVECRHGVTLWATGEHSEVLEHRDDVVALFKAVGQIFEIPEHIFDAAAACSAVGPAYVALIVEAQVEAALRRGVSAEIAEKLLVETMRGTSELLKANSYTTASLRRAVASPGGTTIQGLAALECQGIRPAFQAAIDAVLDNV